MEAAIINRKGARKMQDIPADVLALLNTGEIETVNLTEWLAVDQLVLIGNNAVQLGIPKTLIESIGKELAAQKKASTMSNIKLIGAALYAFNKKEKDEQRLLDALQNHVSDSIRCYACYLIALNEALSLEEKLNQSKSLVADSHFGVREIVWMALRPEIDKNLLVALQFLEIWTADQDENVRRFTTEASRPRGVWCKHIEALKEKPELALGLLEKLKSDPSKYVQGSLGNWLNDASKTQADFVLNLCEKWQQESPTKETAKIIKRARRTIDKK